MLDYGIIGNCKTCSLVSRKGNIEWMCFPSFDSPSIFAKILDEKKGGSFDIVPDGKYKVTQEYMEDTNILETVFTNKRHAFKVVDFFPRYRKLLPSRKEKVYRQNRLIRIIRPIRGCPVLKVNYNPRPNYAKGKVRFYERDGNLVASSGKEEVSLISNVDFRTIRKGKRFELDTTKYFIVGPMDNAHDFSVAHCLRLASWTKRYWKKWVSTLVLPEVNRNIIIRSALLLKLLTCSETGAIIAAPTTSIPEEAGTQRTFDYRFCWVRDAAFAADAFKKIGRGYEARRFMEFVFENSIKQKRPLQIVYGIHGETDLKEKKLSHLSGFRGSKPVRIGNAAYNQKQNDIYGEIIDILYLYFNYYKYETKITQRYWRFLKHLVNEIRKKWDEKDAGIWEFRGIHKHFLYSKLMCFVGVDRAIRLAQSYGKEKLLEKWLPLRDKIKDDMLRNGWNKKLKAFTMYYGGDVLDASVLRIAYHELLDRYDPRIIGTIKRIYNNLRKDYLVKRYMMEDDFGKSKSAFIICSFWLIDSLYYIGEVEKAKTMFRRLIKKANHLGLFSEDLDIGTRKLIGNFPQAYTHIALINSAILLSEWSTKRKKIDWTVAPRKKWF